MNPKESTTSIFKRGTGMFRGSAVQFLVALVILLFVYPMARVWEHGGWIEGLFYTVVMLSGVAAVGGTRRHFLIALSLLIAALAAQWGWRIGFYWLSEMVAYSSLLIFFLFVVSLLIRFILRSGEVDLDVLCAGVAGYLLLGLIWMNAYMLLDHISPLSFGYHGEAIGDLDSADTFYFSFVTLTTLGYGDVAPLTRPARVLTVAEAVTGVLYLGVLVARLVALYSTEARDRRSKS